MDTLTKVSSHLAALSETLLLLDHESIRQIADTIKAANKRKAFFWLIGNGGSAATASHFAGDLRKVAHCRAVALPDMTPTVTAYGNDDGWISMFSYPLHHLMAPGDMLIAFSCSGKSQNVIEAAQQAGKDRLIVFTGMQDRYNNLAHLPCVGLVYANYPDIKVQEDVHMACCHAIIQALKLDPENL